jgi:selenide,water dikinase
VSARINVSEVPVLDEVEPLVRQSIFPGGATRNLSRVASKIQWDSAISDETRLILADPQTSGGLLVAIAPEDLDQLLNRLTNASVPACAVIGEITSQSPVRIEVRN